MLAHSVCNTSRFSHFTSRPTHLSIFCLLHAFSIGEMSSVSKRARKHERKDRNTYWKMGREDRERKWGGGKKPGEEIARKPLKDGSITLFPSQVSVQGSMTNLRVPVQYSYLMKMLASRKDLRDYVDEVEKCLKERLAKREIKGKEDLMSFCFRQNRFPFRLTILLDSFSALFIFCTPTFHPSGKWVEITWAVKIMDFRTDKFSEFVFPCSPSEGEENHTIALPLYFEFVGEIPWILKTIKPRYLQHHKDDRQYCQCETCAPCKCAKYEIYMSASTPLGAHMSTEMLTERIGRQIKSLAKHSITPLKRVSVKIVFPPIVTPQDVYQLSSMSDNEGSSKVEEKKSEDRLREGRKTSEQLNSSSSLPPSSSFLAFPEKALISSVDKSKSQNAMTLSNPQIKGDRRIVRIVTSSKEDGEIVSGSSADEDTDQSLVVRFKLKYTV